MDPSLIRTETYNKKADYKLDFERIAQKMRICAKI
jgi:hypothetical protein